MEQTFTDAGFRDIGVGEHLFTSLRLNYIDMMNPEKFGKIKELATFLNEHPDPLGVISKAGKNINPNMDNLDFLVSYTRLSKQRADLHLQMEKLDKELAYYG